MTKTEIALKMYRRMKKEHDALIRTVIPDKKPKKKRDPYPYLITG